MNNLKVLILEDYLPAIKAIEFELQDKKDKIDLIITKSEGEFNKYLQTKVKSDIYFLDDCVPNLGARNEFVFKKNYHKLERVHQDAKVYYIGSDPKQDTIEYCNVKNIQIIQKKEVNKIILEMIKQ